MLASNLWNEGYFFPFYLIIRADFEITTLEFLEKWTKQKVGKNANFA
jgi:hypothetical protein